MTVSSLAMATPKRASGLDAYAAREDFPVLRQEVHGKPLVYLDNAATNRKPDGVIDAIAGFYRRNNANVHRSEAPRCARQRRRRKVQEVFSR